MSSYLLCGTPRTGSTHLCALLHSTGVLGRPESYFREPDEAIWAARLGVAHDGHHARDFTAFAAAVRRAAETPNGVGGVRVMWGSIERLAGELGEPGESARSTWEREVGARVFVHLRRRDVVAQAVSWYRAEQTGYWQHGDTASGPLEPDLDRMCALVRTIEEHDRAWDDWFARHDVTPLRISYEELVTDPGTVVHGIADSVGVTVPADWVPASPHGRQADATNAAWADDLRVALDR